MPELEINGDSLGRIDGIEGQLADGRAVSLDTRDLNLGERGVHSVWVTVEGMKPKRIDLSPLGIGSTRISPSRVLTCDMGVRVGPDRLPHPAERGRERVRNRWLGVG